MQENITAEESWGVYESTHPSIIDRLFSGLLKTTVTCALCHQPSITYNPFMTISLAFDVSLDRCIENFLKEDYINCREGHKESDLYKCDKCHKKTRAKIKTDLSKLPLVLIFHLKRF